MTLAAVTATTPPRQAPSDTSGQAPWVTRKGEFVSSRRSFVPRGGVHMHRLWSLVRRLAGDVGALRRLAVCLRKQLVANSTLVQVHQQVAWIHEFCRNTCRRHGLAIEVVGELPHRPAVVVANHLGYLDPLVLCSLRPLLPVAKREVSTWPIVGDCGDRSGVMFVERGNPHSGALVLRQAIRALAAGVGVLNFPEGTTTYGDRVYRFCRGIFGAAKLADVPVVPLYVQFEDRELCWVGDDEFMPHFLDFSQRRSPRVKVVVCPPLDPRQFATADALAAAAQRAIETEIAASRRRPVYPHTPATGDPKLVVQSST